ncbi:MAG TPA: phosphoribosylamine--glycine ligase [Gemmatimonadales bacterium]|nr:phosphoribosylamine--glycine ligase [Gemmatimonadales bacterium]
MRVLVIGGGGREHALCWALSRAAVVFCAPGNPGTATVGTNLPVPSDQPDDLIEACRLHHIDLVVVGPEAPLAAGLVDRLSSAGVAAFGPTAAAARIESSKAFAKAVMAEAGVPTATAVVLTDLESARQCIAAHAEPLVVKASGLAGGKGVVVCHTRAQALQAASAFLAGHLGAAGQEVLVEDFLEGEELSVFALTDGERCLLLPPSQDHKRLGDGDTGPNTGGMGAYTPVGLVSDHLLTTIERRILAPTLARLAELGTPYRGLLYAGLMIGPDGPRVLEFNCRFGDPETQVVLPALEADLTAHFWSIARGEPWRPAWERLPAARAAVTTVIAARGYPNAPQKGAPIALPAALPPDTLLFHAGTSLDQDGMLRVAGGRVLCATGLAADVPAAAEKSRRLADTVEFPGRQFRRDIGWREVARAGAA